MAIFVNFASLEQKIPKISRLKTVFKQLQNPPQKDTHRNYLKTYFTEYLDHPKKDLNTL